MVAGLFEESRQYSIEATAIDKTPNSYFVVAAGYYNAYIFNTTSLESFQEVKIRNKFVSKLVCHPKITSQVAIVSGSDVAIYTLDTGKQKVRWKLTSGSSKFISDLSWNPFNTNLIATCASYDSTIIRDLRTPRKVFIEIGASAGALQVQYSPLLEHVMATSSEDHVTLWDQRNSAVPLTEFEGHSSAITCLKWHPNNRHTFLTSSKDGILRCWDFFDEDSRLVDQPEIHERRLDCWRFWFAPDGEDYATLRSPLSTTQQGHLAVYQYPFQENLNPLKIDTSDLFIDLCWDKNPDKPSKFVWALRQNKGLVRHAIVFDYSSENREEMATPIAQSAMDEESDRLAAFENSSRDIPEKGIGYSSSSEFGSPDKGGNIIGQMDIDSPSASWNDKEQSPLRMSPLSTGATSITSVIAQMYLTRQTSSSVIPISPLPMGSLDYEKWITAPNVTGGDLRDELDALWMVDADGVTMTEINIPRAALGFIYEHPAPIYRKLSFEVRYHRSFVDNGKIVVKLLQNNCPLNKEQAFKLLTLMQIESEKQFRIQNRHEPVLSRVLKNLRSLINSMKVFAADDGFSTSFPSITPPTPSAMFPSMAQYHFPSLFHDDRKRPTSTSSIIDETESEGSECSLRQSISISFALTHLDEWVPAPRTCGAQFDSSGYLVRFGNFRSTIRQAFRAEPQITTPKISANGGINFKELGIIDVENDGDIDGSSEEEQTFLSMVKRKKKALESSEDNLSSAASSQKGDPENAKEDGDESDDKDSTKSEKEKTAKKKKKVRKVSEKTQKKIDKKKLAKKKMRELRKLYGSSNSNTEESTTESENEVEEEKKEETESDSSIPIKSKKYIDSDDDESGTSEASTSTKSSESEFANDVEILEEDDGIPEPREPVVIDEDEILPMPQLIHHPFHRHSSSDDIPTEPIYMKSFEVKEEIPEDPIQSSDSSDSNSNNDEEDEVDEEEIEEEDSEESYIPEFDIGDFPLNEKTASDEEALKTTVISIETLIEREKRAAKDSDSSYTSEEYSSSGPSVSFYKTSPSASSFSEDEYADVEEIKKESAKKNLTSVLLSASKSTMFPFGEIKTSPKSLVDYLDFMGPILREIAQHKRDAANAINDPEGINSPDGYPKGDSVPYHCVSPVRTFSLSSSPTAASIILQRNNPRGRLSSSPGSAAARNFSNRHRGGSLTLTDPESNIKSSSSDFLVSTPVELFDVSEYLPVSKAMAQDYRLLGGTHRKLVRHNLKQINCKSRTDVEETWETCKDYLKSLRKTGIKRPPPHCKTKLCETLYWDWWQKYDTLEDKNDRAQKIKLREKQNQYKTPWNAGTLNTEFFIHLLQSHVEQGDVQTVAAVTCALADVSRLPPKRRPKNARSNAWGAIIEPEKTGNGMIRSSSDNYNLSGSPLINVIWPPTNEKSKRSASIGGSAGPLAERSTIHGGLISTRSTEGKSATKEPDNFLILKQLALRQRARSNSIGNSSASNNDANIFSTEPIFDDDTPIQTDFLDDSTPEGDDESLEDHVLIFDAQRKPLPGNEGVVDSNVIKMEYPIITGKAFDHFESSRIEYAEILSRWGMFKKSAEVLKFCPSQQPDPFSVLIACSQCQQVFDAETEIEDNCEKCRQELIMCVICDFPCTGLILTCPLCSHGGHPEHMKKWFQEQSICPMGACPCLCPM